MRRKAASGTKSKADSSVTFKAANPFLNIPIEIRLKIYGYLFLDPPHAKLAPTDNTLRNRDIDLADKHVQDADMFFEDTRSNTLDSDVYDDSDFDYGMFDPDDFNPYGIPMGDMCDGMFNEVYNLGGPMPFEDDMADYMDYQRHAADTHGLDSWFNDFTDDKNGKERESGIRDSNTSVFPKESHKKRHMAILRTNRQIFDEASALLRTDLIIEVEPGDTLTDTPQNAPVKQSGKAWRHDPYNFLGSTDTHGRTNKSSALDGAVEPHVFAQFRKIRYKADFDFELDPDSPSLSVTDDLDLNAEDAAKFVSYLDTAKTNTRWFEDPLPSHCFDSGRRETLKDVADITISSVTTITQPSTAEVVRNFVDLLSSSPFICHLEFVLNIDVSYEEDPNSDYGSEQGAKDLLKDQVTHEKATELFLESGVLNSLRDLTDVMCFSPKVATIGRGETTMKLQQKHVKILRDLKEVIENNWRIKHGSP